jgi:hypothetical protein
MSLVLFFERRDDDIIPALLRPSFKKRQGTKSREVGHRRCRGFYGDLAAVRDLSVGFERVLASKACTTLA